ncbi:MAG: hypothetical protein KTR17_10150 [Cellvibrionaceae bacterium]|nr:hypothetical protein [Cellvibrionaceae bacterium]
MLWYVEKYVTLDSEQKKFAKVTIEEFHQWHRSTQIPIYAAYIEDLLQRIDEPFTPKSVHEETDQVQLLIEASFKRLLPSLADLCETLNSQQIQEIDSKLAKKRKKYKKKFVDASDERKMELRIKELTDYLGQFFGRFTPEQTQWIAQWSTSLKPYEELTVMQQEIWAETFSKAMQHRDDRSKLEDYLQELVLYQTDNWQPELQEKLDHNQAITYQLIAKLLNNRNEKQRLKFRKKLNKYLTDFNKMNPPQSEDPSSIKTSLQAQ